MELEWQWSQCSHTWKFLFGYLHNNSLWSFLVSLFSLKKFNYFLQHTESRLQVILFFLHSCFIWFSSHSVSCSFTFYFPYVHFCLFLVPKILHQMIAALMQAFNYSTLLSFLHLVSLPWDFLAWRLNHTHALHTHVCGHTHSHKHTLFPSL